MTVIRETIVAKLTAAFSPAHLEVVNESANHGAPSRASSPSLRERDGLAPRERESHFKVVIVADGFDGRRLIERHRMVNAALVDELAGPVHALALHAYTRADWDQRFGNAPMSPPCQGGSAGETARAR